MDATRMDFLGSMEGPRHVPPSLSTSADQPAVSAQRTRFRLLASESLRLGCSGSPGCWCLRWCPRAGRWTAARSAAPGAHHARGAWPRLRGRPRRCRPFAMLTTWVCARSLSVRASFWACARATVGLTELFLKSGWVMCWALLLVVEPEPPSPSPYPRQPSNGSMAEFRPRV
jgi:hypothetical protein